MSEAHPTVPRAVTFFEDRAEVVRTASVPVSAGTSRVVLSGVSLFIDDRSLQARIGTDGVDVVSARVVRRYVGGPQDDLSALVDRLTEMEAEQARAISRRDRAESLLETWIDAIGQAPSLSGEAPRRWADAGARVVEKTGEEVGATVEAQLSAQEAAQATAHARSVLTAARAPSPVYVAEVEVQLRAAQPVTVDMELTYRTPAALWRPEHLVRLVHTDQGAMLELTTLATSWQITGEDWRGVRALFSTARPASAASPPPLRDDVVRSRKKTDDERNHVHVESRDLAIDAVRAQGGVAAEMMGVDDGGVPVTLEADGPTDLPSTGEPHRVVVQSLRLPVEVRRVVYPEIAPAAHYAVKGLLRSPRPLLAGPAHIARESSFVGRTRVDFVAAGEPLELGVGPDEGVRVRREIKVVRDRSAVLGNQTITRRVFVFLSNLSDERRTVHVVERVPVSEIDAVKTKVTESHGWVWDQRDGFLSMDVELGPRETRELELAWEVRAGSDVVLPF